MLQFNLDRDLPRTEAIHQILDATDPDLTRFQQRGGKIDYARGDCPVADDLYDRVVTIPLNQWYSARDCRNIAAAINKVLSAYCTEDPASDRWL
jgi:dTDP-4-amino-4,6-dideoxygalactose transaminase